MKIKIFVDVIQNVLTAYIELLTLRRKYDMAHPRACPHDLAVAINVNHKIVG